MKGINLYILLLSFTIINQIHSQEDFSWDEVIPVSGSKDILFNKAKMVLAQDYNDVNNVSRNIDKDNGAILLKAQTTRNLSSGLGTYYTYYFEYSLTVLVKDNKYRLIIDNVHTVKAIYSHDHQNWAKRASTPVSLSYPAESNSEGLKKFAIGKKGYFKLVLPLHDDLQSIFDLIKNNLQKENVIYDDW